MNKIRYVFFVSAIFACLIYQSAQSALVLDQYQLNQNGTTDLGYYVDPSQNEEKIETYFFTPSITGTLKQIDILCFEGQSGNIIIDVYDGISIEALIDQSDTAILQDGWVSFYVEAPVTAGQTYSIGVSENSPIESLLTYGYGYPGYEAVGGKTTYFYDNGVLTYTSTESIDIVFKSWVEPIPEPTTILLFGLGGLVLRKRKKA